MQPLRMLLHGIPESALGLDLLQVALQKRCPHLICDSSIEQLPWSLPTARNVRTDGFRGGCSVYVPTKPLTREVVLGSRSHSVKFQTLLRILQAYNVMLR
eukprot:928925-Amphidinium_carterae.1